MDSTLLMALPLALGVGLTLGLLGGGGSILTLPLLVWLGVPAKDAIAMSLLVVGVTSLAGLVPHARAGRVRWKHGLLFGAAGMLGAFAGGVAADYLSATALMLGFAAMMLATAAAMLRKRPEPRPGAAASAERSADAPLPIAKVLLEGTAVGLVTGLVGAGGGFLVVPALVLLGRLPMREAVGTSLLVLAMKSLAGFAGHMSHAEIDWSLAASVAGAAAAGSLIGARFAGKVPQAALRQAFAWLVVVMALLMVGKSLPPSVRDAGVYQALFVERWPFWAGGAGIAAVVLAFLWIDNKLVGVSTGCAELCKLPTTPSLRSSWRPGFLAGILLGGFAAAALAGSGATLSMGGLDGLVASAPALKWPLLGVAGALIGYGARLAGGCTSGHSIVGVAQLARSSLVATAAFMVGGLVTTQILWQVLS